MSSLILVVGPYFGGACRIAAPGVSQDRFESYMFYDLVERPVVAQYVDISGSPPGDDVLGILGIGVTQDSHPTQHDVGMWACSACDLHRLFDAFSVCFVLC